MTYKLNNVKLWLALWLVTFLLLVAWRAQNLDAFGVSNDEGAHLMWARLALDGYDLYDETQAVQAPLFIESIGWAFRVAGETIQAGRLPALLGFSVLAVALSWLAYQAGGGLGSLTTVIMLGISPLVFTFSRLVMAEVPATALAVVSLALVFVFGRTKQRRWLVASGVALGVSFLVKGLNPFLIAPIALLLWVYRSRASGDRFVHQKVLSLQKVWLNLLIDALWWMIGFCLPVSLVWLVYDPAAMYDQLVAFRGDLRAAIPGSWAETISQTGQFIIDHWGIWLLALGGVISTLWRIYSLSSRSNAPNLERQKASLIFYNLTWSVWLLAGLVMLMWHTPLFPHHFIVLLPPLILLASSAVTNVAALWRQQDGEQRFSRIGAVMLAALILIAALNIPAMVQANQEIAAAVTGGREQQALRLLEAVSSPNDFLMGDSQLLIFMAGRRTPPPLGDVALVAIKANRQTAERMIRLTEAYEPPVVVQWSLRLPWLPEYLKWVDEHYLVHRVWDNDHIIHFGRRIPAGEALPNEQSIPLGDSVTLRGYELQSKNVKAGQVLNLELFWQTESSLEKDYTVFVQLLDRSGSLVAGQDSRPLGGYFPTQAWPVNEIITDVVRLPVPADVPPGEYTLIAGMYTLETLERLPVSDQNKDYVTLTRVIVE